jgi:hypothetical protein
MIGNIVKALPGAIVTLVQQGVPMILQGVIGAVSSIATSIGNFANTMSGEKVAEWLKTMLPKLMSSADTLLANFATALLRNVGKIAAAIGKIGLAIVTGLGSAIWGKVKQAANGIKDRFLAPINALRDKIKGVVDKIKAMFKFTITPPHIKLPHLSISGKLSLSPPSVPKVSIKWYKKAEGAPYMFGNATLFGAGERNDEMLYGRSALMRDIKEATGGGGDIVINLNYTASDDANDMVRDIARNVKLYRMAGAF